MIAWKITLDGSNNILLTTIEPVFCFENLTLLYPTQTRNSQTGYSGKLNSLVNFVDVNVDVMTKIERTDGNSGWIKIWERVP